MSTEESLGEPPAAGPVQPVPPVHGTRGRNPGEATFPGFANACVARLLHSGRGAFAAFARSALMGQEPHSPPRGGCSDLLPLPLVGGPRGRAPKSPRLRGRFMMRRAIAHIANLAILFLNFEAGGRKPWAVRGVPKPPPAVARARLQACERILEAAGSMCRAARSTPIQALGRGRGKLLEGWQLCREFEAATQLLGATGGNYRDPTVVGPEPQSMQSVAEEVDVSRVALPAKGGVLDIGPLLTDDATQRGFYDPETLRLPEAAPFAGRCCDRLPHEQKVLFATALDRASMLGVSEDDGAPPGGVFAVRKSWDEARGVWILRLVLDRRPGNAVEALVGNDELRASMPHGSVWCEMVLEPRDVLYIWASDLPSYYYAIRVTPARARSNAFTGCLELAPYAHLGAVQAFCARTGRDPANPGTGRLCLSVLAMGDLNATSFAQAAHREMLRRVDALPAEVAYRSLLPHPAVRGGVMIDDLVITAQSASPDGPVVREAEERVVRALDAYRAAGVPDVPHKRRTKVTEAVVWGCELRGREGKAGTAREKRAGLAALTFRVAVSGVGSGALLGSLVGLWVDALMYRREAFALLHAVYEFC